MHVPTITPQELENKRQNGGRFDLIDVHTPMEYREVHAETARLAPLDSLDPRAEMQGRNGSSPETIYTICRSGSRGEQAARRFHDQGFSNVVNVEGGTLAWDAAGLPVVRGRKAVSLERQVRIAAGSLVLTGVILGVLVHPGFLGGSAFVGAGLVFSGVTDTCGMGLILARMPWNRERTVD